MKSFIPVLALACLLAGLTGCSKPDADDKPVTANTNEVENAGVTIDADTQARIGLKTATLTPTQWQPQIHAVGSVVDPLAFLSAVTDLASAQAAAQMSTSELARTQKLADQNNASARTLETARAAATHDSLALASARAAFTAAWGPDLASRTDLMDFAGQLTSNDVALVKLSLPVGTILHPLPATAEIYLLAGETNPVPATLLGDLGIDPAAQTQTLLYSTGQRMPRGASVTASLPVSGERVSGLVVPLSAVLRYVGLGWVYVQSGTNRFVRTQIPLDRLTDNGWFVTGGLSATDQVVITGAPTILSDEMGVSGAGGD
jgi:hypothetical protein